MKYIKTYEQIEKEPEIGDYLYCEVDEDVYNPSKFIGILDDIRREGPKSREYPYKVKYPLDQPDENDVVVRSIKRSEVKNFAKTYKELEYYDISKKYNL